MVASLKDLHAVAGAALIIHLMRSAQLGSKIIGGDTRRINLQLCGVRRVSLPQVAPILALLTRD